jgi:hypothetical protein
MGDPRSIPRQIKDECAQGGIADDAVVQALLIPHCGHFHSSSLHPSMTKGSQQSGKQPTSNTAKSTHPPVDKRFFTKKGNPSWPQNGHCGVNGILLSHGCCV